MNLFFSFSQLNLVLRIRLLTSIIIKDVKICVDHITNLTDGFVFVELIGFVLIAF